VVGYADDGARPTEPVTRLIGYGGAAFGGKTDADLGLSFIYAWAHPGCHIAFFRRKFSELEGPDGAIQRSQTLYYPVPGMQYNDSKHRWTFPNGSRLQFCHCQNEKDRFDYQSSQIDLLIIDEATHFTWRIIDYLLTRNRASVDGTWPFCLMTTNPGGIGHAWYRKLFIDAGAFNTINEAETPNEQIERTYFIPARLEDNPIGRERDPEYEKKLEARDEQTQLALRYGVWDIATGIFFSTWRSLPRDGKHPHVIEPIPIQPYWRLYGSVDYGHNPRFPGEKPFVYGLYAMADDGHCYRIDELAGAGWGVETQIEKIRELEAKYAPLRISHRSGCPSMFTEQKKGSPTVAEDYGAAGVFVEPSHTDRVNGHARCRQWLLDAPDGRPWFMSFSTCRHFNAQVTEVIIDEDNPEDIDEDCEEHAIEEWRHFLMSRPVPGQKPEEPPGMWSPAWWERRQKKSSW
jgi:hypothetical protein